MVCTILSIISLSISSLSLFENNALSKVPKNFVFSSSLAALKNLFVSGNILFTSLSILVTCSIAKLASALVAAFSNSFARNCSLGLCPCGVNTLPTLKKNLSNCESL